MKLLTLAFLALVLASVQSKTHNLIFSITWLQGFCDIQQDCRPQTLDQWDHQSFTIHGLWPQQISSIHLRFDDDILDGQLLDNMMNYMPPSPLNTDSQFKLWKHEVERHGGDYVQILEDFGQKGTRQELQVQYFEDIIKQYKKLNVRRMPKNLWTLQELADHLNLQTDQFFVQCAQGTSALDQIRFCLEMNDQGLKPTKCWNPQPKHCDNSKIQLGAWKESQQDRVHGKNPIQQNKAEEL